MTAQILSLAVLLGFCVSLRAEEPLVGTEYHPLKVGSTWHYKLGPAKAIMRVQKYEKIGDIPAALVEIKVGDQLLSHSHFAVLKDGVYHVAKQGKKIEPPLLDFPTVPTLGKTWKVDSKGPDGEVMKGSFSISKEEVTVEVPAGKFKAIEVIGDDIDLGGQKAKSKQYFVKGIGWVKQEIDAGGGNKLVMELEKYEPAK